MVKLGGGKKKKYNPETLENRLPVVKQCSNWLVYLIHPILFLKIEASLITAFIFDYIVL